MQAEQQQSSLEELRELMSELSTSTDPTHRRILSMGTRFVSKLNELSRLNSEYEQRINTLQQSQQPSTISLSLARLTIQLNHFCDLLHIPKHLPIENALDRLKSELVRLLEKVQVDEVAQGLNVGKLRDELKGLEDRFGRYVHARGGNRAIKEVAVQVRIQPYDTQNTGIVLPNSGTKVTARNRKLCITKLPGDCLRAQTKIDVEICRLDAKPNPASSQSLDQSALIMSLQSELSDVKTKYQVLTNKYQQLCNKNSQIQVQMQDVKIRNESLEETHFQILAKINKSHVELQNMRREGNQQVKSVESKIGQELKMKEDEIKKLLGYSQGLKKKLEETNSQYVVEKKKVQENEELAQKQTTKLTKELEELKKSLNQIKKQKKNNQQKFSSEIKSLNEKLSQKEQNLKLIIVQNSQAQESSSGLLKRLKEKEQSFDILFKEHSNIQTKSKNLEILNQNIKMQLNDKLQQLKSMQSQNKAAQKSNKDLQEKINQLISDHKKQIKKIETQKDKSIKILQQQNQQRFNKLKLQYESRLTSKTQSISKQQTKYENQHSILKSHIQTLQQQIVQLEAQNKSLSQNQQELQRNLSFIEQERSLQINQYQEHIHNLTDHLKQQTAQYLANEISCLNQTYNQQLQQQNYTILSLKKDLNEAQTYLFKQIELQQRILDWELIQYNKLDKQKDQKIYQLISDKRQIFEYLKLKEQESLQLKKKHQQTVMELKQTQKNAQNHIQNLSTTNNAALSRLASIYEGKIMEMTSGQEKFQEQINAVKNQAKQWQMKAQASILEIQVLRQKIRELEEQPDKKHIESQTLIQNNQQETQTKLHSSRHNEVQTEHNEEAKQVLQPVSPKRQLQLSVSHQPIQTTQTLISHNQSQTHIPLTQQQIQTSNNPLTVSHMQTDSTIVSTLHSQTERIPSQTFSTQTATITAQHQHTPSQYSPKLRTAEVQIGTDFEELLYKGRDSGESKKDSSSAEELHIEEEVLLVKKEEVKEVEKIKQTEIGIDEQKFVGEERNKIVQQLRKEIIQEHPKQIQDKPTQAISIVPQIVNIPQPDQYIQANEPDLPVITSVESQKIPEPTFLKPVTEVNHQQQPPSLQQTITVSKKLDSPLTSQLIEQKPVLMQEKLDTPNNLPIFGEIKPKYSSPLQDQQQSKPKISMPTPVDTDGILPQPVLKNFEHKNLRPIASTKQKSKKTVKVPKTFLVEVLGDQMKQPQQKQ